MVCVICRVEQDIRSKLAQYNKSVVSGCGTRCRTLGTTERVLVWNAEEDNWT